MGHHLVHGRRDEDPKWELVLVDLGARYRAPLVDVIKNSFTRENIKNYINKTEEGGLLVPIFEGIMSARTRRGLRTLDEHLDINNAELLSFDVSAATDGPL